jgi:RNA polymerase sigma-70 factor (ECF subfamily)
MCVMTDSQPSDIKTLVLRAGQGDRRAQNELLERFRPRLRRMIAMRLDHRVAVRVDPSDIVQDALNAAHKRLSSYLADPRLPFYPWLRRIAWDRLLKVHRDHIDTEKRSVLKEHAWTPNLNDESVAELAHCLVADSGAPDRKAIEAEMQARTAAALTLLKPEDREILVLRYLEQLSVEEIATVLEISHTAVTSRHFRALQRIRRLLRDEPDN